MHNKVGFNRLGRKPDHRRAMLRNLVASLLDHEHLTTTKSKAREACRKAEKMITRAKNDTVHNRRLVARDITDKDLVKKLFSELAPRYATRNGGYTRIIKIGFRQGDAAEMVVLELVDRPNAIATEAPKAKKATAKKTTEVKAKKEESSADSKKEVNDDSAEKVKKAPAKKAGEAKVAKKDATATAPSAVRRTTNRGK